MSNKKYTYRVSGPGPDSGRIQKVLAGSTVVVAQAPFNDFYNYSERHGLPLNMTSTPKKFFDYLKQQKTI